MLHLLVWFLLLHLLLPPLLPLQLHFPHCLLLTLESTPCSFIYTSTIYISTRPLLTPTPLTPSPPSITTWPPAPTSLTSTPPSTTLTLFFFNLRTHKKILKLTLLVWALTEIFTVHSLCRMQGYSLNSRCPSISRSPCSGPQTRPSTPFQLKESTGSPVPITERKWPPCWRLTSYAAPG